MPADITQLQIKILYKDVPKAEKALKDLVVVEDKHEKQVKQTEKALKKSTTTTRESTTATNKAATAHTQATASLKARATAVNSLAASQGRLRTTTGAATGAMGAQAAATGKMAASSQALATAVGLGAASGIKSAGAYNKEIKALKERRRELQKNIATNKENARLKSDIHDFIERKYGLSKSVGSKESEQIQRTLYHISKHQGEFKKARDKQARSLWKVREEHKANEKSLKEATLAENEYRKSKRASIATMGKYAGGIGAVYGAFRGLKAVISTTSEFEQLQANLYTVTGSTAAAATEFEKLKTFATETPFDLQSSVRGFIQMRLRGLDPTMESMRAMGDLAASVGYNLEDMSLAVANATVGEFETVKKLGMKMRIEGDKIAATFKGQTVLIDNNTQAIQRYFTTIGQEHFGGAMARQMDTLSGAFSNLGDNADKLFNAIGEAGVGGGVKALILALSGAVDTLTTSITEGDVGNKINAWASAFRSFGIDGKDALAGVTEEVANLSKEMRKVNTEPGFWERVWYGGAGVGATIHNLNKKRKIRHEASKLILEVRVSTASKEEQDKLIAKIEEATREALKEADTAGTNRLSHALGLGDTTEYIQFKSTLVKEKKWLEENKRAALEYAEGLKKINEERKRVENAPAAGPIFSSLHNPQGVAEAYAPKLRGAIVERTAEDMAWDDSIREKYLQGIEERKRLTIEEHRNRLEAEELFLQERLNAMDLEGQHRYTHYQTQRDLLLAAYEVEIQDIRDNENLKADEKYRIITEREKKLARDLRESTKEEQEIRLNDASKFFGNMSSIAAVAAGKESKVFKALAITETLISTYQSAQKAYTSMVGVPVVGPALATAAAGAAIAHGYATIRQIQSVSAGSYEHGGIVDGADYTGDRLTAQVNSGEMILNRGQQRNLFNMANQSAGGQGNLNITIVPANPGETAEVIQDPNDPQNIEILMRKVDEQLTSNLSTQDGQFIPALTARIPALQGS